MNAATGKKLWEFGSGLAPLFTYNNGFIYGLTQSGSLYAVSEAGKKAWSASITLPKATNIQRLGSTIYVTQEEQLAAVDAVTGKIKWKAVEKVITLQAYQISWKQMGSLFAAICLKGP